MVEESTIDPTSELDPPSRPRAPRLDSLAGRTVGLLDISKPRGDIFLDRVADRLAPSNVKILRFTKPTFTKIAPMDLRQQILERCDAVIEALAD